MHHQRIKEVQYIYIYVELWWRNRLLNQWNYLIISEVAPHLRLGPSREVREQSQNSLLTPPPARLLLKLWSQQLLAASCSSISPSLTGNSLEMVSAMEMSEQKSGWKLPSPEHVLLVGMHLYNPNALQQKWLRPTASAIVSALVASPQ